MKTWITTIGQTPFAAINTLWAALREDRVKDLGRLVVFQTPEMREHVLIFTTWAEQLFSAYLNSQPRLKIVDFPADDFAIFRAELKKVVHQAEGGVLIDMTSGRKAVSAIALVVGELFPGKVERVYYSLLADADYAEMPYPALPVAAMRLFNMTEKS